MNVQRTLDTYRTSNGLLADTDHRECWQDQIKSGWRSGRRIELQAQIALSVIMGAIVTAMIMCRMAQRRD
jgi:hypothetical protein